MPPVYIASTVEVVLEASRGGRERRNVIHYQYTGTGGRTLADLEQLAQECFDNIVGKQQDLTCTGTSWQRVTATDLGQVLGGMTASISGFRAGLLNTSAAPGNVAFVLTKRTGLTGPSHRGRFYLFDLPEGGIDDDTMQIGFLPPLNTLAGELLATRVGGSLVPCVASRTLQSSTPLQSITFDMTSDSQRRRLTGRGR